MAASDKRIADNLSRVQHVIATAAQRSGRSADDVTLVAVTKYVDLPEIEPLLQAGCRNLGESRPQELWRKAEALTDSGANWHMIGHLQRNKARRTVPFVTLLHSGDGERLLNAVDRIGQEVDATTETLLEVNISSDETKHGLRPEEVEPLLPQLATLSHVRICGLMAMAAWGGAPEDARRDFVRLRELRDQIRGNCPSGITMEHLSMGMSGDYEVAIEEGATLVRVGSALFEGVLR